ncbi:MAG: tetratricopeptide repeat protein [Candidatus Aminicenantes bacterium]|nr:MAG: tetratricopeptide repeat protein [Candidatus Aminicenantes bacterium]
MKVEKFLKLSLIILISLLILGYVIAQGGRGKARIAGVVLDEEGNPIKSAKIVVQYLKNEQIKLEATINKKGEWSILGLGTGMWKVTASAEGYIPTYVDIYVRQLGKNPKITLTLKKTKSSDKAIIQDEPSFNLLEKANQLFTEKQYDDAIALLEQFLEQNPHAYQASLSIGDCYQEKGELDKAIEEYNSVLEQAKIDDLIGKEIAAKALAGIGECYLKKEDLETAQNYFKQSIDSYPENEILAYNVGEIYFSNQKIDEAIHYFELSIQIKSDWGPPYLKLGYAYLNKANYEKAGIYLNKFLEIDPESPEALTAKNVIDYLEKIKN